MLDAFRRMLSLWSTTFHLISGRNLSYTMANTKYLPGKFFTGKPCKNGHVAERWKYNGMCVECKRDADRASNITAGKRYRVKKLYGVTVEDVKQLCINQNNKCAICSDDFVDTHLTQIDHCHVTGKVRGLLCINCNWLLGKSRDNPELLRAAAKYLERAKGTQND